MEARRKGEHSSYERRMLHKDGTPVWTLVSAVPILDSAGRFAGSFGMFTDITARKAVDQAIRESEERFRLTFDTSPDSININRSGLAMVGAADFDALHGRLVWDFTRPRYVRLGQERFGKCLRDGTPLPPAEFELIGPGGRPTHIESSAVPIRYRGSPALLAVWRDVTSRKAAESALRENEELFRGTFDFSPIGQTMSDLDYRYLRCNEAFCRFLGYPERELVGRSVPDVTHPEDRHTRSVVRELVDGKTGQAQFQKRYIRRDGSVVWGDVTVRLVRSPEGVPRHMLSVVQDITERVLNAQEKEKLEAQLRHYIESASGAIVADPTQMQQVLMNLCTNAAHAMEREGGILQIRMADVELGASDVRFGGDLKPGRYVRVTVTDTGHGIDPAVIKALLMKPLMVRELAEAIRGALKH